MDFESLQDFWYLGVILGSWAVTQMIWAFWRMSRTLADKERYQKYRSKFVSEIMLWLIAICLILLSARFDEPAKQSGIGPSGIILEPLAPDETATPHP